MDTLFHIQGKKQWEETINVMDGFTIKAMNGIYRM